MRLRARHPLLGRGIFRFLFSISILRWSSPEETDSNFLIALSNRMNSVRPVERIFTFSRISEQFGLRLVSFLGLAL